MRSLLRAGSLITLLLLPTSHSFALPDCNYSRLVCGTTCRYQEGWGGSCSGSASSSTSYCWWEVATSDYGSAWPSCHQGAYDACCDEITPN